MIPDFEVPTLDRPFGKKIFEKSQKRSIRYKFDKSKYPSFNNPDGYLTREKCAKLTKLFIVVGVTAVCDKENVQPN